MKKIISSILLCTFLLSSVTSFAHKYEIEYGGVIGNPVLSELRKNQNTNNDEEDVDEGLFAPPSEHPYVFVNKEYIEHLKANKNSEIYRNNYNFVLNKAKEPLPPLPADKKLSYDLSDQINMRAFMYAMGEVSKEHAKETVEYTLKYLDNPKTTASDLINIYKDFGNNAITTGSFVYDWCYDAMTAVQRQQLADKVREFVYAKEQTMTPANVYDWTEVGGKAVGEPLQYNSVAAVALYDVYPEMYNAIMPKIHGTMADIVKMHGQVGALSDGAVTYARDFYAYYVALLFERMGYPIEKMYGNQEKMGYKMMYARLPYGAMIKMGDDPQAREYQVGRYTNSVETRELLAYLSSIYDNPYFRYQYIKEHETTYSLEGLLLKTSSVEPKMPDDLPLAMFSGYPRSDIIARTSWQDGLDSPAVVAYMQMFNRRSGDHDHSDIGNFQLHYKGPLTIKSGHYKAAEYGLDHWGSFQARTVAANCVTVYKPGEIFAENPSRANDGGQKMPASPLYSAAEYLDDSNLRATTEAYYIGPNEKTPAFSYIKGDLTKAYSEEKITDYNRSMVFMDTFNETYPGVMVVFDKVDSSNKNYKKNWLLQAVSEPEIEENKITIKNTENGCNGMLVNRSLYPKSVTIKKVGDIETFISDGKERPMDAPSSASNSYKSGWRCEVSPKTQAKEDIFLNSMYVADADSTAPELPMIYEESDKFMGVTTLDRMVMFSKNADNVKEEFTLTVRDNGYKDVMCLITDIEKGSWQIEGNGNKIILNTDEESNCLMATLVPGEYTFKPIEESEETKFVYAEIAKEKIGDFAIKVGSTYSYVSKPNKIIDGVPYFEIADFAERHLKCTAVMDGDTLTLSSKTGAVIKIKVGEKKFDYSYASSSRVEEMKYEPKIIDGDVYINHEGICEELGFTAKYSPLSKVLRCNLAAGLIIEKIALEGVDEEKVVNPMYITAINDDGNIPENVIDRNLGTRWSALPKDGAWICFDLGAEYDLDALLVAFYNGDIRNWKFDVQVSNDGENFKTVLEGQKSGGNTKQVERFQLPAGTKARYIRYVGHGEEVTATLYTSITEMIVLKK